MRLSSCGCRQMLSIARAILGHDIRFDHCCNSSGRAGGDKPDNGMGYHSHTCALCGPRHSINFVRQVTRP